MLFIKVYVLPGRPDQKTKDRIEEGIVAACTDVPDLNIRSKKHVTVVFQSNESQRSRVTQIVIEVLGQFNKSSRGRVAQTILGQSIAENVKTSFSRADVVVLMDDGKRQFYGHIAT